MGLFTIEAEGRPVMVVAAEDWEDWATFLVEVVDPTGGADDGDEDE